MKHLTFCLILTIVFCACGVARAQTIVTEGGTSTPSLEKDFRSVRFQTRMEACQAARESALDWIRENTETNHRFFQVNQLRRGWAARSGGASPCDCSKDGDSYYVCSSTARIVQVEGGNAAVSGKRFEQSFLGVGFSRTSSCDEAKNRASASARAAKRSISTGPCDCEARPGALNEPVWQCRVDATME